MTRQVVLPLLIALAGIVLGGCGGGERSSALRSTVAAVKITNDFGTFVLFPVSPSYPGGTMQLYACATDAAGGVLPPVEHRLHWASSDPATMTIDPATGLLTALRLGTATITATEAESGVAAQVEVAAVQRVVWVDLPVIPCVGETVAFRTHAWDSGDQSVEHAARWDWENDGCYDTPFAAAYLAASHCFPVAGWYTPRVEVQYPGGDTDSQVLMPILVLPDVL